MGVIQRAKNEGCGYPLAVIIPPDPTVSVIYIEGYLDEISQHA